MWRHFCIVLKELLTRKKLIVDDNMSEARWAGRDQDKKQQEDFFLCSWENKVTWKTCPPNIYIYWIGKGKKCKYFLISLV